MQEKDVVSSVGSIVVVVDVVVPVVTGAEVVVADALHTPQVSGHFSATIFWLLERSIGEIGLSQVKQDNYNHNKKHDSHSIDCFLEHIVLHSWQDAVLSLHSGFGSSTSVAAEFVLLINRLWLIFTRWLAAGAWATRKFAVSLDPFVITTLLANCWFGTHFVVVYKYFELPQQP